MTKAKKKNKTKKTTVKEVVVEGVSPLLVQCAQSLSDDLKTQFFDEIKEVDERNHISFANQFFREKTNDERFGRPYFPARFST